MLVLVVPIALLAALLYAVSDFLEQRAARRASETDEQGRQGADGGSRLLEGLRHIVWTMRRLLRDRLWFAGWTTGTVALFVQAGALHLGSVAVVQSLQVTTLLFAIPLTAVGTAGRPGIRDWAGGSAVVAGLAVLLVARGSAPVADQAHRTHLILLLIVLAGWVAGAVAGALLRGLPERQILLALAAGTSFGVSAALVKLTLADLTGVGVAGTARDWVGYGLALATGTGMVLQQVAFAEGRLAAATTAMITSVPFVGYLVAVIGFSEQLPSGGTRLAGIAAGGLLVIVGVSLLAHSSLLFGQDGESAGDSTRRSRSGGPVPEQAGA